jgi:GPH family glycoside/pentoside/hexuronide:cation symporter
LVSHAPGVAPLKRSLLLVFALPGILQAFMTAPTLSILQGVYAKETGIALVGLGTALIIVRIFDLFSDLLIGYWSDRLSLRGAGRKVFIGAGSVVGAAAFWSLSHPPAQVTPLYFGFWFLMGNVGWSLIEIPYRAWSLEFTSDYVQRARVVTWIVMMMLVGNMLFFATPAAAKALGLLPSGELNLQALRLTALVVAVIALPLTLFTLARVPRVSAGAIEIPPPVRDNPRAIWASIIGNQPLINLICALAVMNFMSGLSTGVQLLYFTNYLGMTESAAVLFAIAVPVGMLGVPFWGWVAGRVPRERMWAGTLAGAGLATFTFGLLDAESSLAAVTTLYCTVIFFMVASAVVAPALLGDIVDYGKEKLGVDRAGLYLSVQGQVVKAITAVAGGAGLIFLGWLGFDATRTGAAISASDVTALKWCVAWLPTAGYLFTAALIWFFPVGRRRPRR